MCRVLLLLITICWGGQLQAAQVAMHATSTLTPSAGTLSGEITLRLGGGERIYNVEVSTVTHTTSTLLHRQDVVEPSQALPLQLELPRSHPYPGRYHLLLTIAFTDAANQARSVNMAISYAYGELGGKPALPLLDIDNGELSWDFSQARGKLLGLAVSTAPHWHLATAIAGGDALLPLEQRTRPTAGQAYPQYAVLNWAGDDNYHYSRVIPWNIRPGANSSMDSGWREQPRMLLVTAWVLLATLCGAAALYFRHRGQSGRLQATYNYGVIAAITLWLAHFLHPQLWFLETWPSGGDLASHVLYADRFAEWFLQGKITGWMHEVFAGFPAFRFYFPLPFALIAVGSLLVPIQVAIKLAIVIPPLLMPLSVYWMAGRFHWPGGARLCAAIFTVAFLIHDGASVWGGNLPAIFAGEFAYSWGMLFVIWFWGSLAWALRHGGRRWIAPAIFLSLTALSHGYPLLVAGFSGLFAPLFMARPGYALLLVLRVHATAFLLIGFWLIPLLEYIPFTIPNDTSVWVKRFSTFVPHSLLPVLLCLPLLALALRRNAPASAALSFLLLSALLAATAYFGAYAVGLADIRLIPFAQLAMAIACGGALGLFLQRWGTEFSNWSVAVIGLLLIHYWLEGMAPIADRARWSMEGYENKAMWPHYQALANHLAGPTSAPRVLFEHAPVNADVGSTRAMEALPLFGSRPVLEGLYMEAAFSGPFIYQMQADVSKQPSSPLARFPAVKGTAMDIAERMTLFYADTVVIRSPESNERFKSHPEFTLDGEFGPFSVFRIRTRPKLIAAVTAPQQSEQTDWLERNYEDFVLAGSRDKRSAMSAGAQASGMQPEANIEILSFQDEYLKFRTDRPGVPHRIKISYHPGWYSRNGEAIHLTAPSFMLITPDQAEVELVFGETPGQLIGRYFSLAGLLLLMLPLLPAPRGHYRRQSRGMAYSVVLLCMVAALALYRHPGRNYQIGHEFFREGDFSTAAGEFSKAIPFRSVRAQKAEVLFWAARANELAGDRDTALGYYRQLITEVPASYWAPESLYRMAHIYSDIDETELASQYAARLLGDFPDNNWSTQWLSQ